jgi:membrane-associated phospholipid phosphatase
VKAALDRFKRIYATRPLRFWLMLGGIVLALMGFEEVYDDVFSDPQEGDFEAAVLDKTIRAYVSGLRTKELTQMMTDLTALGSVSVIATIFAVFVSILITFRDWKGITFLSLVLAGGGLWPHLLKPVFARARPEETTWLVSVGEFSFPSGHSFGAAATYLAFAFYASQYARSWSQEVFFYILGGILAGVVGISRIYLGVHFPTDVLAGLCGGVAWGLLSCLIYQLVFGEKRRAA